MAISMAASVEDNPFGARRAASRLVRRVDRFDGWHTNQQLEDEVYSILDRCGYLDLNDESSRLIESRPETRVSTEFLMGWESPPSVLNASRLIADGAPFSREDFASWFGDYQVTQWMPGRLGEFFTDSPTEEAAPVHFDPCAPNLRPERTTLGELLAAWAAGMAHDRSFVA